ncbi:alpha-amylase [Altererythrobacter aurantiacus]|uniref:Alpha-amylase n=1 Tax=Parapontixanthobacter aurantiacus TaxID=1463599 RepID=A0A844Z7A5_9SPHN|nr:alpha-amylase family glycosyl hydrolase [Parapontixanthobacter aurantiacus]MXO84511.1 alpha-amylase [Parapontixanthobacter aurantiacus]
MLRYQTMLTLAALALAGCQTVAVPSASAQEAAQDFRDRLPEDEIVYFVLPDRFANGDTTNDRGGLPDERLVSGFDPSDKGFFHGGDLAGLTEKLDYIEGLGVTAIWFAPIFKNKPVQGPPGNESAGYHGYWVTDFTQVDPHFGTNAEFEAFVDAAHARGMKVYMDIITNHTADVIRYEEGDATDYVYRSLGDYPYSRRLGPDGEPINDGFLGDEIRTEENFAKLVEPGYAYTPVVPADERGVKVPGWLNDPIYYHNRGDTTFSGESSRYGDFVGLDDLFTEHPRVLSGMIDIYGDWIRQFGIDGFRIDTARHVNPEFWQSFVPAMQAIAQEEGIPNFHIFGEVYKDTPDSGYIAQYTRRDGFPAVLDFAFQTAVMQAVSGVASPEVMAQMFDGDVLYEGGEATARTLPTFLGNHDMGRFSTLVKERLPGISQDELLARVMLGHAMLMTLRGSPVIYYGDEQGFVGDGNDQAAREDMFASATASYNDNDLLGTQATTATENYDTAHPLYRLISELAALRKAHPALARGRQVVRSYDLEPGLFAVSRFDPDTGREYLVAFNTSAEPLTARSRFGYDATELETLAGQCPAELDARGSVRLELPAFGWAVCRAANAR